MEKQKELLLRLTMYTALGYIIIVDQCCYGCPLEDLDIEIDQENKIVILS